MGAHEQHSNGTYGAGIISNIRPLSIVLATDKSLPEGPVIYPFNVSFHNTVPTDTFTLSDGTVLYGCAAVLDLSVITTTQRLSAVQSLFYTLDAGNNTNQVNATPGDWYISTDSGQLLRFGLLHPVYDAGTPAVVNETCTVSGVSTLYSIAPSKIVIFKSADGGGTSQADYVCGNGNFVFANYKQNEWALSTFVGSAV